MNTSLFKLVSLSTLLFFAQSAAAITSGAYSSVHLAMSKLDYDASNQGLSPAKTDDDAGFAWDIRAGYQFNPNFGLEIGYIDWSDVDFKNVMGVSGANADIEQRSADILGKFILPFNSVFNIHVKGGFAYVKADLHANGTARAAGVKRQDHDSVRPMFGLGGAYEFYPNVEAELTWLRITDGSSIQTSDFLGLGLNFFFN